MAACGAGHAHKPSCPSAGPFRRKLKCLVQQHFLDHTEAQQEPIIQPDSVRDDLRWETVVLVTCRCGLHSHQPISQTELMRWMPLRAASYDAIFAAAAHYCQLEAVFRDISQFQVDNLSSYTDTFKCNSLKSFCFLTGIQIASIPLP